MNRYLLIIVLFFFSLVTFANSEETDSEERSGWELIQNSKGIKIYERWVKNSKNDKVKQRKGKMVLSCSIDEVVELISNCKKTHLWMSTAEKVEILKKNNKTEWYQYTVLDTPWPFNKQDMVSRYNVIREPKKHRVKVLIRRENNLLPKKDGIDRLDTFDAEWEIVSVGEDKVKVSFTTRSTEPPKYPSWMQDPVVRKVFFSNLSKFKDVVVKA